MRGFSPLFKLLLVLALLYLGYSRGLPWLQENLGGKGASSPESPSYACLEAAEGAKDDFLDGIRPHLQGDRDHDAWSTFERSIETEISHARRECGCPTAACRKAGEALGVLGEVLDLYRDPQSLAFGNPATKMERAEDLLAEARRLDQR